MKQLLFFLFFILAMTQARSQIDYSSYPVYKGKDLGLTYSKQASSFRIWSPVAEEAEIILYKDGDGSDVLQRASLVKSTAGTWMKKLPGDLKGMYYTFRVKINGEWGNEVPDPYAKAAGVNGKRAMILDLKSTDPAGWTSDKSPAFSKNNLATDAVIYELHIRDASIDTNSGIINKGKFTGLAELNTKSTGGLSTGLSHIKELGVTHVHLLPFFDYNSVDESKLDKPQYNWGYDPLNYNIPEGSYSTDPYDGAVRIKELKEMIAAFHKNGLRVVMDVVYNHVADAGKSNFNQLVPGYYFRHKKDGSFSDATACGNETASEMPMMQKFILESVLYWVKEYHIDGFRFDLMGVHDIKTMNIISKELRKIKPGILLYGEGWTAGASPLPDSLRALKANAYKLDHIAVFSDDIRDGIKGSVFDIKDRGFVSGKAGMEESVKFGIVAASEHPQVKMTNVNYSKKGYAAAPWNVISYCECHDNNTLWDKLSLSWKNAAPEITEGKHEINDALLQLDHLQRQEIKKMHQLALTIILTSQGVPFLHAGTEFLRNKKGVENSYNAGDSINEINWALKEENKDVNEYVRSLIQMRKAHPAFRFTSNEQIKKYIRFDEKQTGNGVIVYTINGLAVKDAWKKIFVAFNGSNKVKSIDLPAGKWKTALGVDKNIFTGKTELAGVSSLLLYQE
ncbi:MAG: type I pullulanase [Ferruginibacter sp.]